MAALTVAAVGTPVNSGSIKTRYVDITGPTSYTTGGEALSAALLAALMEPGLGLTTTITMTYLRLFDAEHGTTGHTACLDRTNKKILFFNGTTQIANGVDLTSITLRVKIEYGIAN